MLMNKVLQGNFYFLQGFLNLLRGVFQLMWSSLTPPPSAPFEESCYFTQICLTLPFQSNYLFYINHSIPFIYL